MAISEILTKTLINKFIGLSDFISRKLSKITNPDYKSQKERVPLTSMDVILKIMLVILYFGNFFINIMTLNVLLPESKTYFLNQEFSEDFQGQYKNDFKKFSTANSNLMRRLKNYFYDPGNKKKYFILGDITIDTVTFIK